MKTSHEFALQFDAANIEPLVARYDASTDEDALDAGREIASGTYTKTLLKSIVIWKSPRRAGLIDQNTDRDIAVALRFATAPDTPEAMAIAVLTALNGVGIPVASAILAMVHPAKFTVIDYRALASLGVHNWPDTVGFYMSYLKVCRELATKHGQSLRNLDIALWQWSKEQEAADGFDRQVEGKVMSRHD